jgi:uncharacterized RDD family membrane protein YckC
MTNPKSDYFLPKTMTPASALDRVAAQLIDIILLILCSFAVSIFTGTYGLPISAGLFVLYFIICHRFWGQTLGKKIIGIRLISVGAESLTFWRVLLRESFGRVFCLASFFIGYFRILFNKDRRGLHDLLSGSAVIAETRHQTSFAHLAGLVFTVFLTLGFSTYYLFFKSTYIAQVALQVLQYKGVKVSSLSGNMAKGWHIESFAGGNSMLQFTAKGIHIAHSPAGFYSAGVWRAQELAIDELDVKISPSLLNFEYIQRKPSSVSFAAPTVSELSFAFYQLKGFVEQFKVGKLTVSDGNKLHLRFDAMDVKDISYENGIIQLKDFKTSPQSPAKIEVSQLVYRPANKYLQLKMKLFAKKEMHKDLQRDLDVSFNWTGPVDAPKQFKLSAFANRFHLTYINNELKVSTNEITPSYYLKTASDSFSKISVKLKNGFCQSTQCLQKLQGKGSFFVHQRKVDFKDYKAWLVQTETEVLKFNYNDLVLGIFEPQPVLKVISEESLQDFVSQFYFQKSVHQLTAMEQSIVNRDQKYFKVLKERYDPNNPKHIDTFLIRSPTELSETK